MAEGTGVGGAQRIRRPVQGQSRRDSPVFRAVKSAVERERLARSRHNSRQGALFDRVADDFLKPLPADVVARTARLVSLVQPQPGDAMLDVGTGTGALLPHLLAMRPGKVVACDLSAEMLRRASRRYGAVVRFVQSDVADLPISLGPFDLAFCNAVFGNFYDQHLALRAIHRLLRPGGRLVISHPMGRQFVRALMRSQPGMVRHELPERAAMEAMGQMTGFHLDLFVDELDLYVAVLDTV